MVRGYDPMIYNMRIDIDLTLFIFKPFILLDFLISKIFILSYTYNYNHVILK